VAAQVIGSSGTDLSRSIYIDKGSNDGIKPDMAVITAGGIVGKVWIAYPSTSLVLLINDQTSGVGAMLEKSRLQGVLKGTPDGAVILERVMSDEKVESGETVLSSGGDQIFPKGLPVGTVTKVSPGREMFLHIEVKPAADLSRLEEVLVVTEKQEHSAVAETGGRVRAADILAQRLPSVPDKPVAAAGTTAAGSGTSGATGQGTGAGAKAPATGSTKPDSLQHAATPSIIKVSGGGSTVVAPSGANAVSAGSAHGVSSTPQPTAGEAPKKAVSTASSADSAASGSAASNPAGSPAEPAAAQPKPPVSQPNPPNPQAPATENDPH